MRQNSLELPALPVEAWEDEVEQPFWDAAVEALIAEVEAEQIPHAGSLTARRDELATWCTEDLLAEMSAAERESRAAQARVLAAMGELASRPVGYLVGDEGQPARSEFTPDHVALAVGVAPVSASKRINEALLVRERYPLTFAALSAGLLGMTAVRYVLAEASAVADDRVEQVERRVLAEVGRPRGLRLGDMSADEVADIPVDDVAVLAGHATPGRVQKWVRRAVVQVDRAAARRVRAQAGSSATVQLTPGSGDGMAWLGTYVPEEQALAGYQRIDDLARARMLGEDVDSDRLGVTRSQVFMDLLLGGRPGETPAPVNIEVLVDREGVPHAGRLGPVIPTTVEGLFELAALTGGKAVTRVVEPVRCPGEHHQGGADDPYVPSTAMRRTVQVRDIACIFPGCTRAADRCELDHTVPWPHGPTCPCNLAALCKHHHRLKHRDPGWRLVNHGNGHLVWTTPWRTTYDVGP